MNPSNLNPSNLQAIISVYGNIAAAAAAADRGEIDDYAAQTLGFSDLLEMAASLRKEAGINGATPFDAIDPPSQTNPGSPDLPPAWQPREVREVREERETKEKAGQAALQGEEKKRKRRIYQDECIPGRGFVREFLNCFGPTTDAPKMFHLGAALACVAVALDRKVWLHDTQHILFPNVYIALCAESTRMRKSTALIQARETLEALGTEGNGLCPYILESPMSTEALKLWEGRPRGLLLNHEFGDWLRQIERKSFAIGLKGALTRLFDCPPVESGGYKTKEARFLLDSPYINILSATTKSWLTEALTQNDLGSGFIPRFLFLSATLADREGVLPRPPRADVGMKNRMVQSLRAIADLDSGPARLSPAAGSLYDSWFLENDRAAGEADENMIGFHGRMESYVLKFSLIYQASFGFSPDRDISGEAMEYSVDLAELILARTRDFIREDLTLSRERDHVNRIGRLLRNAGEKGMTKREMLQRGNLNKSLLDPVIDELLEVEQIKEMVSGRGHRYFWIGGEEW